MTDVVLGLLSHFVVTCPFTKPKFGASLDFLDEMSKASCECGPWGDWCGGEKTCIDRDAKASDHPRWLWCWPCRARQALGVS